MKGRKPTIGPQDFQRLYRATANVSHEAQRLEAAGYVDLARKLRDAAYIIALVDVALATEEDARE